MAGDKNYILRIDSYTGGATSRDHHQILDSEGWNVQEVDALYAIVNIRGDIAQIVDDGYCSLEEAQKAWPDALPQQTARLPRQT